MTADERACQFAPFAALTGFGEVITEQSRTTDRKIELDEYEIEQIDSTLRTALMNDIPLFVTYFVKDEKKAGGKYITRRIRLKGIDPLAATVTTDDGLTLSLADVMSLQADADCE